MHPFEFRSQFSQPLSAWLQKVINSSLLKNTAIAKIITILLMVSEYLLIDLFICLKQMHVQKYILFLFFIGVLAPS